MLRSQGDVAGALEAYRKDLAIAEFLAEQGPPNDTRPRDLSVSHHRVGDLNLERVQELRP